MSNLDPIRRALKNSPDSVPLLLLYGQGCLEDWSLEEALATFQRVLERDSTNFEARLGLAHVLFLTGRASEAVVRLESLLTEQPRNARVHLMLARTHFAEGDIRDAKLAYRRACELDNSQRDTALERDLGIDKQRRNMGAAKAESWAAVSSDEDDEHRGDSFSGGADEDFGVFDDEPAFSSEDFERPVGDLDSVVGLSKVKEVLRLKFVHPHRHPDLFRSYGMLSGGSVLLLGPPGCGKSALSRAIAAEAGARYLSVRPHQLLDMYIGNSEKNLNQVFELARANAPVVLFFDDVEAMASNRRENRSSVPRSVVQQFLGELDVHAACHDGVLVLAATSTPWLLDPAFRRPGRFDPCLYVPPPNKEERKEIFLRLADGKPVGSLDLDLLAEKTPDFSAAEMAALFSRGVELSLSRSLSRNELVPLETGVFLELLPQFKPSLPEWWKRLKDGMKSADDEWPIDVINQSGDGQ